MQEYEATSHILFGAFDRHNFGDLLFPHVVGALLADKNAIYAGLAERDLRCYGGHRVVALARLAREWGDRPVKFIHVGGELLTCESWQAAVMLLPPDQVQQTLTYLDNHPEARLEWAGAQLGIPALAPYTLSAGMFPGASEIIYNAVGGVELGVSDAALRAEVLAKLGAASAVSVRDRTTQQLLAGAGIAAMLIPDPAAMVSELFGSRISRHADRGEVSRIRAKFPQGYVAFQFSADFGDDATLAKIAAQLDRVAISTGYGVVMFRAGAAPWHDDPGCYRRIAARMHSRSVGIFTSLDLWDICALIANSRVYCGSSLHGRIVATAFALPRITLLHPNPASRPGKQAAYAATWEDEALPATVEVDRLADGIGVALSSDHALRLDVARELAARYRNGFYTIHSALNARGNS